MKVNETCVKAFQKVFDLLEERKQLTSIIDQGNTINSDEESNSRLEFYGDSSDDGKVRLDTPSGIVLASTDVTRLTLTPFVLPIVHPLMFTGSATRFFSCVLSFSLFLVFYILKLFILSFAFVGVSRVFISLVLFLIFPKFNF